MPGVFRSSAYGCQAALSIWADRLLQHEFSGHVTGNSLAANHLEY